MFSPVSALRTFRQVEGCQNVVYAGPPCEAVRGFDCSSLREARRLWDVRSLTQVKVLPTTGPVTNIELSRQGSWMTTCAGRDIAFWKADK